MRGVGGGALWRAGALAALCLATVAAQRFTAVPQHVAVAGQGAYTELAAQQQGSGCYSEALRQMKQEECERMDEESRMRFAIFLSNCFLEASGQASQPCSPSEPVKTCAGRLEPAAFATYRGFFISSVQICLYLANQGFHRTMEELVNRQFTLLSSSTAQLSSIEGAVQEIGGLQRASMDLANASYALAVQQAAVLQDAGSRLGQVLSSVDGVVARQQQELALMADVQAQQLVAAQAAEAERHAEALYRRQLADDVRQLAGDVGGVQHAVAPLLRQVKNLIHAISWMVGTTWSLQDYAFYAIAWAAALGWLGFGTGFWSRLLLPVYIWAAQWAETNWGPWLLERQVLELDSTSGRWLLAFGGWPAAAPLLLPLQLDWRWCVRGAAASGAVLLVARAVWRAGQQRALRESDYAEIGRMIAAQMQELDQGVTHRLECLSRDMQQLELRMMASLQPLALGAGAAARREQHRTLALPSASPAAAAAPARLEPPAAPAGSLRRERMPPPAAPAHDSIALSPAVVLSPPPAMAAMATVQAAPHADTDGEDETSMESERVVASTRAGRRLAGKRAAEQPEAAEGPVSRRARTSPGCKKRRAQMEEQEAGEELASAVAMDAAKPPPPLTRASRHRRA